jgi:hypothetical protein
MDYDEWLKAGNGAREDESLEDVISRTVDSMYDGITPEDFFDDDDTEEWGGKPSVGRKKIFGTGGGQNFAGHRRLNWYFGG